MQISVSKWLKSQLSLKTGQNTITMKSRKIKVAILLYDKQSMFELGCAIELFALPRPQYADWYQTDIVSFQSQPVEVTAGIHIQAKVISKLENYQMLVIPGWSTSDPGVPDNLRTEIIKLFNRKERLISFCSGSFLLAELGLLDNLNATTHWRYADVFKQRYPDIHFCDNVLYTFHDQIACSAGSAAALDLGLEIIKADFGYKIANQVARRLVVSPHRRGGQSQYVETPIIQHHDQFSSTLDWVKQNLTTRIDINQLANRANMSRRSFDRHFRAALDMGPRQWINQQKLELARQLLEHSSFNIEQVAEKSGFENSMNLRLHFNKSYSVSPAQYRSQFFQQYSD